MQDTAPIAPNIRCVDTHEARQVPMRSGLVETSLRCERADVMTSEARAFFNEYWDFAKEPDLNSEAALDGYVLRARVYFTGLSTASYIVRHDFLSPDEMWTTLKMEVTKDWNEDWYEERVPEHDEEFHVVEIYRSKASAKTAKWLYDRIQEGALDNMAEAIDYVDYEGEPIISSWDGTDFFVELVDEGKGYRSVYRGITLDIQSPGFLRTLNHLIGASGVPVPYYLARLRF